MSTTTIRMPEGLKSRVTAAAREAGITPHAFMLQAIADKADANQLRADFEATAEKRYATMVSSGKTIPWADMRRYMQDRLAGRSVRAPRARKLAR